MLHCSPRNRVLLLIDIIDQQGAYPVLTVLDFPVEYPRDGCIAATADRRYAALSIAKIFQLVNRGNDLLLFILSSFVFHTPYSIFFFA
jgi:hypothetical protein